MTTTNAHHPGFDIKLAAGTETLIVLRFVDDAGDPQDLSSETFTCGVLDGETRSSDWVTIDDTDAATGQIILTWDISAARAGQSRPWWLAVDGDDWLTGTLNIERLGSIAGGQPQQVTVALEDGVPAQSGVTVTQLTAAAVAGKASQADLDAHEADTANPHSVTKTQVGLGDVDNTADADKPVSSATQTALDAKVAKSGDTMTGSLALNAAAPILVKNAAGDTTVLDVRRVSDTDIRLRWYEAGQGYTQILVDTATGAMTLDAETLEIPAPTGSGEAAQVTAIDVTTGRLQIGGIEVGTTGPRNIGASTVNGWTAHAASHFTTTLTRTGNMCMLSLFVDQTGGAPTGATVLSVPLGFRPTDYAYGGLTTFASEVGDADRVEVSDTGLVAVANYAAVPTTALRLITTLTWVTDDAWPSSLPGSAA